MPPVPQLDLRQHPLQRDVSKVVTYLEPHPAPGTQDQPASPISRTPLRQRKRAGVRLKHSLDHRDWEGLHWKPRGTLQSDSVAPTPGPHSIERRGSPPPPRLSVSPVGKREPKEPFPTLRNAFSARPIRVSLASKRSPGEPAGHHDSDRECRVAATSTQTSADRLPMCQTQSRDRSHGAASLAGEHSCLAVLTDLVSSQRALPAHSAVLLQQESKYTVSVLVHPESLKSENLGSRRAHPIVLAGLRVRPVALSNC